MSKKNNYKVYVHINKINGKRYYGITKQEVEKRWANGYGYKRSKHFWDSICKYGWNNFEHIVIAKGLTEEEAKWLEIELIREHDTTNKNKGYNITKGGEGTNGYKHSEETKKKISEAGKGKTISEEQRKKLSEARKGENLSEETRKKLSEAGKGKNNSRATKVYCVELDMYFDTINEASEYVGCNRHTISQVLTKNNKTAGDYHWLYAEDVNEENINRVMSQEYNEYTGKPTKVYCVELDKYFDSITEASKYVGCSTGNISDVLGKNNRTCKGYHWLRAEDVEIENSKVS